MQPVHTFSATTADHSWLMVENRRKKSGDDESENGAEDTLPQLNPWREVGWIFKDGEAIAIERSGDEARTRKVEI